MTACKEHCFRRENDRRQRLSTLATFGRFRCCNERIKELCSSRLEVSKQARLSQSRQIQSTLLETCRGSRSWFIKHSSNLTRGRDAFDAKSH